jgi:hypothetical protein
MDQAGWASSLAPAKLPRHSPFESIGVEDIISQISQHGRGNQADIGIGSETQQLVAQGVANSICTALDILMQQAKSVGDAAKWQRIKKTQKSYGCRLSR